MRGCVRVLLGLVSVLVVGGCRTATKVAEVPRVDLDMNGSGNRGYLVGRPPPSTLLKTTRQMVETTVEVPSIYTPKRSGASVSLGDVGVSEESKTMISEPMAPSQKYDTYVVQKGDSLWSIAAQPEIYGKATRWRRILDANHDLLKGNPDRISMGMKLKIPRGGKGRKADMTSEDEGTRFKK